MFNPSPFPKREPSVQYRDLSTDLAVGARGPPSRAAGVDNERQCNQGMYLADVNGRYRPGALHGADPGRSVRSGQYRRWRHLVGEDKRERADERAVSDRDGARPSDVADGSDA